MYASCFDANAGIFEALLGENDAVFSDQLNHASIIDGIRLAKTRKFRYKHKGVCCLTVLVMWSCLYGHACIDMQELGAQLKDTQDAGLKLIVSDGVFSMDGSITPLQCVCVHVSASCGGREGEVTSAFLQGNLSTSSQRGGIGVSG